MASVPLATSSIYSIGVGVDDKNPNNYSLNLGQSGLGLPDRDYYLSDDKALADTWAAYRQYLTDMISLAGIGDASARADRVLALETGIAKVQWTRADRRDADKIYNPMPVSELKTLAPDFPWDAFLAESHIPLTTTTGSERYAIVAEKPLGRWPDLPPPRYRPGAIIWWCIICSVSRPICPSGSTTAISRSMARCWRATRSS